MFTLLVIDDEPDIHFTIEQVFEGEDVRVLAAETAEQGLELCSAYSSDVILLDIRLGNQSGLDLFHELRRIDPKALIIFITGHGTTDTAIEAMKRGAYDYLVKPLDATRLQEIVRQAFRISRLMHVPAVIDEAERPEEQADRLIGSGQAMQAICKQIGRLAPQDVNVLILGESGTGKELVARAIYHHSRRNSGPFLAINCAAIPETLLEGELFGHETGAFTGADRRRIGKFEQCNGGTILLDEVGDMTANTQAKVLRLLEEGRFERLGGNETVTVDVRLIAATNQNLDSLIEQGRFRKDLYYRLRGAMIQLPPLRERREDIPELSHYFLYRLNREIGTAVQSIAPETLQVLQQYDWPGNVRELQSVIREALIASAGSSVLPEFLPAELHSADGQPAELVRTDGEFDWQIIPQLVEESLAGHGDGDLYRRVLQHVDRILLTRVLQHTGGNQSQACKLIGLSHVTLRAKLRSLGLSLEKVVTAKDDTP